MAFHEDLRNHRLKKGLILEDISADTKINIRILQALEQGDYHILPVPYIRLFMKAYAQAIDYPVEDILRGLENELKLTGEQGIVSQINSEILATAESSAAGMGNSDSILQATKGSQSSTTRLIGGLLVLILVIFFGKMLLNSDSTDPGGRARPILPVMNLSQSLDSLSIADSLLVSNMDSVTINSLDYLSIVINNGPAKSDTLFHTPGQSYTIVLTDSMQLNMYPSEAALLSIRQDTLPGSPFSNAWLSLTADSTGGHLRTYSTL
ncbi:MAG: helix-turn-helix domain-containing protein [Candidatus Marinimicrobia bacterium]|nr:helix-turn-helix domain-containing protein [Candidatus Neomarinimicrobiota bacterium]MCF7850107.1 helix-turn-helix domain-containing protein [Candidatus Neomarinimicrobiota bacterium]MCF7905080.1 helix-turn-helix domain-containing protein [Candidatus Neomarinimicrobiota bacterium]